MSKRLMGTITGTAKFNKGYKFELSGKLAIDGVEHDVAMKGEMGSESHNSGRFIIGLAGDYFKLNGSWGEERQNQLQSTFQGTLSGLGSSMGEYSCVKLSGIFCDVEPGRLLIDLGHGDINSQPISISFS